MLVNIKQVMECGDISVTIEEPEMVHVMLADMWIVSWIV